MPIYALDYAAPSIDPQAYVHPDAVVIGSVELGAGARHDAARTARRLCAAHRAMRATIHHAPQVGRGTP